MLWRQSVRERGGGVITRPLASVPSCYSWLVSLGGSDSHLSMRWHRSEEPTAVSSKQNHFFLNPLTFTKDLKTSGGEGTRGLVTCWATNNIGRLLALKFQCPGLQRPCRFMLALPSLNRIVPKISLTTREHLPESSGTAFQCTRTWRGPRNLSGRGGGVSGEALKHCH